MFNIREYLGLKLCRLFQTITIIDAKRNNKPIFWDGSFYHFKNHEPLFLSRNICYNTPIVEKVISQEKELLQKFNISVICN